MGNSETKLQYSQEKQISEPHEMLGKCKIVKYQNKYYLTSEWQFVDPNIYRKWKQKLEKMNLMLFYDQNNHSHIKDMLLLPLHEEYMNSNLCGNAGILKCLYDQVPDSLVCQIEHRCQQNLPFKEQEIWFVAFKLVTIASYFHKMALSIGDIKPENIFVDFESKKLHISTINSWINQKTLKQKYINNESVFLTPQYINSIKLTQNISQKIAQQNDNFAIGMTLAEMILLQDLSTIYTQNNGYKKINESNHKKIINCILSIKYYPMKLLLSIASMIRLESSDRMTANQLFDIIQRHSNKIENFDSFDISKQQFHKVTGTKFESLSLLLFDLKLQKSKKIYLQNRSPLTKSNILDNSGILSKRLQETSRIQSFGFSLSNITKNFNHDNTNSMREYINKVWLHDSNKQSQVKYNHKIHESGITNKIYSKSLISNQIDDKNKQESQTKKNNYYMDQSQVNRVIDLSNNPNKIDQDNQKTIPILNLKSPEIKIRQFNDHNNYENFSFHSSQKKPNKPYTRKFGTIENSNLNKSQQQSIESIILAPFPPIHQLNPISSYVSYQYSKSSNENQMTKKQAELSPKEQNLYRQYDINRFGRFAKTIDVNENQNVQENARLSQKAQNLFKNKRLFIQTQSLDV